jgi:solute:Na+ symporter, SSS family
MRDFLPPGLLGLLVAAFLAAYMSTISTHLNWGSSYVINDFYRRFIRKGADEKHYVFVSRAVTLVLAVISSALIFVIHSISGAWAFIIECGAGIGLVLILRWYWWRINAWSEIVAMVAPATGYVATRFILKIDFPESLFLIVAFTTVCWVAVTLATEPTDEKTLAAFCKRVAPGGPGWKGVHKNINSDSGVEPISHLLADWIIGIILIYAFLFSIGRIIFRDYFSGFTLLALSVVLFVVLRLRIGSSMKKNSAGHFRKDISPVD